MARQYILHHHFDQYMFYGGRENADRVMLGVFPDYKDPEKLVFPITSLTARYPKNAGLTHRDFLGALMGLKITRESIGDLLLSPGRCDFFVQNSVSGIVLDELLKVGSFGVKMSVGVPGDFVVLEDFDYIRGTVSSARIDSLIGLLLRLSREKALELIKSGVVRHNFLEVLNGSKRFEADDIFSVRGYGKYVVDEIGDPTKKGRLPVVCRRYK